MAARRLQAANDYAYAPDYDYNSGYDYSPTPRRKKEDNPIKKLKEEQEEINQPLRSRCFWLVIIAAFMAASILIGQQMVASAAYELGEAKKQVERVERENDHLKVEIAGLKSPQRIKAYASQHLGMVVPNTVYYEKGKR